MIKKILLFLLVCSAANVFGLTFYVGQHGEKMPENGFKTSNCNWGRSLHYATELYKMKPCTIDEIHVRGGQIVEIDQNLNIGSIVSVVGQLVYAKGKTIKLSNRLTMELQSSKMSFEKCNLDVGKSLTFAFWHKSRRGGLATLEFIDTTANFGGTMVTIVPVHPDVSFKNFAGPYIVLKGKTKLRFGTGVVIDEIYNEMPNIWKCTFKFEMTDSIPMLVIENEAKAKGITFEFDTKNIKAKPGTYALMTLTDRSSKFENSKFILNGKPYTLGSSFNANGKSAKIEMGPSPIGKDSSTANDIILTISK